MKTFNGTAFAKLNLYLGIHGLREDGYHELETVFQAIDLCDLVSVSVHHRGGISLRCNRPYLPVDNRNLAYKAAEAFFRASGVENPGLHINIKKVIPVGAGMAGGSTDAACVLRLLNRAFGLPLSDKKLAETSLWAPTCLSACGAERRWPVAWAKNSSPSTLCPTAFWWWESRPFRCPPRRLLRSMTKSPDRPVPPARR